MLGRTLFFAALLGLLSACGVRQNLRPDEPVQLSGTEAILLMGMQPAGYRIHLLRGKVEEGHWVRPTVDVPEVNIEAEAGFIMVKVAPTFWTVSSYLRVLTIPAGVLMDSSAIAETVSLLSPLGGT